ncbi:hypothetical protein [Fibrisoma limi]|nr:hypothetical protein [Fibrisoma limi]
MNGIRQEEKQFLPNPSIFTTKFVLIRCVLADGLFFERAVSFLICSGQQGLIPGIGEYLVEAGQTYRQT